MADDEVKVNKRAGGRWSGAPPHPDAQPSANAIALANKLAKSATTATATTTPARLTPVGAPAHTPAPRVVGPRNPSAPVSFPSPPDYDHHVPAGPQVLVPSRPPRNIPNWVSHGARTVDQSAEVIGESDPAQRSRAYQLALRLSSHIFTIVELAEMERYAVRNRLDRLGMALPPLVLSAQTQGTQYERHHAYTEARTIARQCLSMIDIFGERGTVEPEAIGEARATATELHDLLTELARWH